MTDRLKYGDIVGWESDGHVVRWMIVVSDPKYGLMYKAAWVSAESDLWELGQVKVIGVYEDTPVISRG